MRVGSDPREELRPVPDLPPRRLPATARLRAAVVGCSIGRRHAAAFARLRDHFELVAVCDTDRERARQVAAELGGIDWTQSYEDLLDRRGVDVVSICTPPYLHFEHIVKALAAGCHVICEKPLVGSLHEMDQLASLVAKSPGLVIPVFQMRYGAGLQKLKHLVAAGVTGRCYLSTIETAWRRSEDYYAIPWRRTWKGSLGGCLLGHAVHAHDMLSYINGPVTRVQAFARTLVNPVETEDCASASLELADGSLASLSVTLGSVRELTRLRFCFENLVAESNVAPYDCSSDPWLFEGASPAVEAMIEPILRQYTPGPEGYDAQFLDAHGVIVEQKPGTTCLADARTSIELVAAMYHSALHGTAVNLPLSKDHPAYQGFKPAAEQPFGLRPGNPGANP